MSSFAQRLAACKKHGELTISDLAHWFARPVCTVRTWLPEHGGRDPHGPAGRLAQEWLTRLELCIKRKRGFPVPASLSWHNRPTYIREQRDDAGRNVGVPRVRATG